jgi:ribosomal protein L29
MKKKEIEELKTKPLAELKKSSDDIKVKLRSLKFDLAAGKVKNVSEIKNLRKSLARTLTFINQSEEKSL